jgi:hypothetical protein
MTPEQRKVWDRVKKDPNTVEDWRDLHDTIEAYRRRYIERHTKAPEVPSHG